MSPGKDEGAVKSQTFVGTAQEPWPVAIYGYRHMGNKCSVTQYCGTPARTRDCLRGARHWHGCDHRPVVNCRQRKETRLSERTLKDRAQRVTEGRGRKGMVKSRA